MDRPAARRSSGGPETFGVRAGTAPPPASAGDSRSVATSKLASRPQRRPTTPWFGAVDSERTNSSWVPALMLDIPTSRSEVCPAKLFLDRNGLFAREHDLVVNPWPDEPRIADHRAVFPGAVGVSLG